MRLRLTQTSSSLKKTPSRLCLSYFTTKPHSEHLIRPTFPFIFTHCALLSHILVKYPSYFCNSATLIKGDGFPIKAKWQIAVAGLFRSLFNQRIAEWEKAITEWIEAGICKEMSGRVEGYESHWLKPLIWCWLYYMCIMSVVLEVQNPWWGSGVCGWRCLPARTQNWTDRNDRHTQARTAKSISLASVFHFHLTRFL